MLTDPNCDGSMQALHDAAADNDAYIAATDDAEILKCYYWQVRDLDRLRSRNSDEVTTW